MHAPARHGAGPDAARQAARVRPWGERLRWDPGRRGLAALGLAVIIVLAASAWWLATGRPKAMPVHRSTPTSSPVSVTSSVADVLPSSTGAPVAGPAPPSPTPTASVVVDVAGKVRRPGVYTLAAGSRVYEALRAAGGVRRGASTLALNLAAPVLDGEQIVVGVASVAPVAGPPPGASPAATSATSAALIDLNTATLEQLESLPGVGPVLGQNILDWRNANGRFTSVDQLSDVSGIGDVRLAQLRPLVTV
jgi:competence protein ComEA